MKTQNPIRRAGLRALLLVPALVLAPACTDLTEVPGDALTPQNAFRTEEEILAGVASVYAQLRSTMWGYYNLNEISTDEMIVPTRGSDWYDNGRWLEIYRQTWAANSGSALDDMNGTWNDLFSGVARTNLMISVIESAAGSSPTPSQKETLGELRLLRAWYYFMLQDFFGGVPLVTNTEVAQRPRVGRDSIFKFLETELIAAAADLPATRPAGAYGRVTKGAANAILASLYINAGVYTKDTGINAAGYNGCNFGTPNYCQKALDAANAVINSGVYSLATDWKSNFSNNNEGSPENIFVIVHSSTPGLGMSLPMRTLHYNQLAPSPWNGFATIAETYNAFSDTDVRKQMFLVGQQRSFNTGAIVQDRAGNPLVFTVDIANADQATEAEGPRFNKFPPLPDAPDGNSHPNDFPYFRLAEMYLIKAEAMNELGQTAGAITEINRVRNRAIEPDAPLAAGLSQAQVRTAVYNERLLEFTAEGRRRRDMVRYGTFVSARRFKTAQGAHKVIFPIPQTQLQANPLLAQNAGY